MRCKNCSSELATNTQFCVHCGDSDPFLNKEIMKLAKSCDNKQLWGIITIGIIILSVLGLIFMSGPIYKTIILVAVLIWGIYQCIETFSRYKYERRDFERLMNRRKQLMY